MRLTKKQKNIVRSARALISSDSTWTTGTCARKKDNSSCSVMAEDAVKFCAEGALRRAANNEYDVFEPIIKEIARRQHCLLHMINDVDGRVRVLLVFDEMTV
jgi:hypothetical protein